jgi:hypothetical protein
LDKRNIRTIARRGSDVAWSMTVSHWQRGMSPRELEADLAIIGAGVCGLSAALHAQRRGLRCVVLERHAVGSGASTRNAGFLMRGCWDHYASAVQQHGRERARELWKLTERNLEGLRGEGIGALPGTRDVPSVLLALKQEEADVLRQSHDLLRADGFAVGWQETGEDTLWKTARPRAGLINPHDAACNSAEVIALLRSKLTCPVLEHQEVFAIQPRAGGLRVRATNTHARATRVLVCTNAYGPQLLPELARRITPRRGQMIALRAPGLRLDASYYVNFGSEYLRQTPDGTVVVGGCRTYHAEKEIGTDDTITPWVQDDIERFARAILGDAFEITARWAGIMGFSDTHLPILTPVASSPGVWFCGGFTGHGMSMAYEFARGAVESVLAAPV